MHYKYPDTAIIVFCKAPIAGQVKTRLMPYLTAQQAAEVHIELTQRVLSLLYEAQICSVQLWCSPDTSHPFFIECVHKYQLSLQVQHGNDLGERMHHAINKVLETSSKVLLIGCDCPSLTREDIEFAINGLQKNDDVIFAPAEDGGYVMVGLKKAHPELFLKMAWGYDGVLDVSRQCAIQASLRLVETRQQWDVDVIDDLKRYQQYIS